MRSVGEGFVEYDKRIKYFIKYSDEQNFGDYLAEFLSNRIMGYPKVEVDVFWLIGSVIYEEWIAADLKRSAGLSNALVAFWCCGMREAKKISSPVTAKCLFFGVRGPLTRDMLHLPIDTVIGDPGFLMPIFHVHRKSDKTSDRTICIPHCQDPSDGQELLAISGADLLVKPIINASEKDLIGILDQIISADFVLTGSLHGAVIAAAYNRPFSFWNTGHLDCPFKWQDLAASLKINCIFAKNVREGRAIYSEYIRDHLKTPPLTPILDMCPFTVPPSKMIDAMIHDG